MSRIRILDGGADRIRRGRPAMADSAKVRNAIIADTRQRRRTAIQNLSFSRHCSLDRFREAWEHWSREFFYILFAVKIKSVDSYLFYFALLVLGILLNVSTILWIAKISLKKSRKWTLLLSGERFNRYQ